MGVPTWKRGFVAQKEWLRWQLWQRDSCGRRHWGMVRIKLDLKKKMHCSQMDGTLALCFVNGLEDMLVWSYCVSKREIKVRGHVQGCP